MEMVSGVDQNYAVALKRMMQEQIISRGVTDARVVDAMTRVPRHLFVDDALKSQAYIDAPLNIGEGQTISQPYIVAVMTQALGLKGHEKILEIGTGCGYQTTILMHLAAQIYTIERIKSLALQARSRFKQLGLKNVVLRIGDGSLGWKEAAPFDRIIVTCAAPVLPDVLISQLVVGGILLIPVSVAVDRQDLLKITKTDQGAVTENLGPCRFVRLIGKHGYHEDFQA